jgi:hypothetical protein
MTTSKRSTKKTTSPQIRRSDLLPARVVIQPEDPATLTVGASP